VLKHATPRTIFAATVALTVILLLPRQGRAEGLTAEQAVEALGAWLVNNPDSVEGLQQQPFATTPLGRKQADLAAQRLWEHRATRIRRQRAGEMRARVLVDGDLQMPFDVRVFGEKPETGRSLYLSLHGGGGAPKQVNDQQWRNQQRLYAPEEGVYVAPRAPTDTWDLWHQPHIDRMFDRLIENLVVFASVDPNRVYLMGYSAGGDGVYQLAPRMADRWAGAAMMAGHPNDALPLGLRNTAFTLHVGAHDAAYRRNEVAEEWQKKLADLHEADPQGYIHWVHIHEDKGHWMDREDAAALPWMARHRRNPLPAKVVWKQDNVTHGRFYWLAVDDSQRRPGALVTAVVEGGQIELRATGVDHVRVRLHDALVDLDRPVRITSGGRVLAQGTAARTIGTLSKTLEERGDRHLMFPAEMTVSLPDR